MPKKFMQNQAESPKVTPINQRIVGTEIFLFSKDSKGNFTYSAPFTKEEANATAEAVNNLTKTEYAEAKGMRQGLSVDGKTFALFNMNTLKGIVANKELSRQSSGALWLPTIEEGIAMHEADIALARDAEQKGRSYGMLLSVGQLFDFGTALFNNKAPDEEIANSMCRTAQQGNYSLPVLASFKSLGLKVGGERYGVMPELTSGNGLISGEKAEQVLNKFRYRGNSGVRRLCRDGGAIWNAGWGDDLDGFDADCRVGRKSGVASAKNLAELTESQIKNKFSALNAPLREQMRSLEEQLQGNLTKEAEVSQSLRTLLGA